jgi:glucan phosphorylase
MKLSLCAGPLQQRACPRRNQDTKAWTRMSILNTARSGKFSSDRAIVEYCDDIWNVERVTVRV